MCSQVYIHGPLEFPDISTKHQHSAKDYYMKLYVTAITVYTAPEAAKYVHITLNLSRIVNLVLKFYRLLIF